eukprot:TRINITY_DN1027_c0_g1_i6.p1 TRINITY_DN1027_c0_g1~~TRINITY_DN1027_c0_g1_i6.p1  ORF type:complete len:205 (-),score=45.84 TRINITY_DN1027_c0_g1_i6:169-783(-)
MFVGSVVAINVFGAFDENKERWGTLGSAMMTIFVFVTGDNWADFQEDLDKTVGKSSRFFSVIVLFLGNLVFTNMFIGVIIQNLDEATEEESKRQKARRQKIVSRKKAFILARQQADYKKLIERHNFNPKIEQHTLLESIVGKLRHDDLVPTTFLGCNNTWLELFTNGLEHQENTMYRLQQLHFEIATTLVEIGDRGFPRSNANL